jgi:hypothetical protein
MPVLAQLIAYRYGCRSKPKLTRRIARPTPLAGACNTIVTLS